MQIDTPGLQRPAQIVDALGHVVVAEAAVVEATGELVATQQPLAVRDAELPVDAPRHEFVGLQRFQRPHIALAIDEPGPHTLLRDVHIDGSRLARGLVVAQRQLQLVPAGQLVATGDFVAAVRVVFIRLPQQHQFRIHDIASSHGVDVAGPVMGVGAQVERGVAVQHGLAGLFQVPAQLLQRGRRFGEPVLVIVGHWSNASYRPQLVAARGSTFTLLGRRNREAQRATREVHRQHAQWQLATGMQFVCPDAQLYGELAPGRELGPPHLGAALDDLEAQARNCRLVIGVPTGVAVQPGGSMQGVHVLERDAPLLQRLAQTLGERLVILAWVDAQRLDNLERLVEGEAWCLGLEKGPESTGACFVGQRRRRSSRGGRECGRGGRRTRSGRCHGLSSVMESTMKNGTRCSAFRDSNQAGKMKGVLHAGFARPDRCPVRALTGATHPRFG